MMRVLRHLGTAMLAMLLAFTLFDLGVSAASSPNLSRSYHTDSQLQTGSIVSLDSKRGNYVVPANVTNAKRLLGVTVQTNDSLLAVDPNSGMVQVATSGSANVLASTLNGDIRVGDQVAVSPFNGIGMKTEPGSYVLGIAQTALTQSTEGVTKQTVTDKTGNTSTVYVGYIRLTISVGTNTTPLGVQQLSGLQKLAKSLTGHTVSTLRIAIALMVALIGFIALVTLIYASIYGSIISVGRNPLAKFAIFRTLSLVLLMAMLIAAVSGVTVYFLLK